MRVAAFLLLFVLSTVGQLSAQTIVAHRGASGNAPENTLAAFHLAWEEGADAIEADFYLTKDGKIACIHDKDTLRTSGETANLVIAESTLAELRNVDVGRWKDARYAGERIPTLEEVLATVPEDKAIFVEIKSGPEILAPMKPILENSGLRPEQIRIICFDEEVIRQANDMMPQYETNWLTSYKRSKQTERWRPSLEEVIDTLKHCRATGLGTKAEDAVVDAAFTQAIRDAGFECHVWTVNDPAQAKRYARLGYDSITTNYPELIRRALESEQ